MAKEKISDDEVLRRAEAVKELKRLEGFGIGQSFTVGLRKSNETTHIDAVDNPGHCSRFHTIADQIFRPLLADGLKKYYRRIRAIADGRE